MKLIILLLSGCTLSLNSREGSDLAPSGLQVNDDGGTITSSLPSVLTQHNDSARTGANLRETALQVENVNPASFGKLFSRDVEGYVYAQPLVVSGVTIQGQLRNVVYVATEHNNVYAFDADDPAASAPLWMVNLGTPVSTSEYTCLDLIPEDGITSTPVVDPATGTIYVSAKHKDGDTYAQTLHALDLASGAEKMGGPVDFGGAVPGSGWGSGDDGLMVPFNAKLHLQRPALLLANGQIYAAFGSHCDRGAYHGWLMAYDKSTLQQTAIWNVTPNGGQGSIWMSGQGPSVDSDGNVYVITANGDSDPINGTQLSESFVKLSPKLNVLDWFMPYDYQELNDLDLDLGSDGVLLVPDSNLVIAGGKEGILYVIDRLGMGHHHDRDNSNILQSFQISQLNVHGTPVYWKSTSDAYIYVMPEETRLMAFRVQAGALDPNPTSQSLKPAPMGMPGGFLSISADGDKDGSAVLWVSHPLSKSANNATVAGILRAFDARDVSREIWNSEQNAARDSVGNFAKFNAPTVVNGKVYLGTFSGKLLVYGLLQ